MTAHRKYIRLEAIGVWRERPGARPREVVVSFGSATLILTDLDERPLGHWALAGVTILGEEDGATVYSMTADGAEALSIRDAEMVAAISAVARLPPPGGRAARRRIPAGPLLALAVLAGAIAAAPPAIRSLAGRLLPVQVDEIGDRMLIALIERHGAPCAAPEGEQALARLAARIDPTEPPRLRVMPLGAAPVALLPDGTVLLDRTALAAAETPEEIAGLVVLARGRDAEAAFLDSLGPIAGLGFILTGNLGEPALAAAADSALQRPAPGEIARAADRLAAIGLDPRPFLDPRRPEGIAAADPPPPPASAMPLSPALADADWVTLRQICE
jgi:hypothetical protein